MEVDKGLWSRCRSAEKIEFGITRIKPERSVSTCVLCVAIKWPFVKHPQGNNLMCVNVRDDVSISSSLAFSSHLLMLDKVNDGCEEVCGQHRLQ